MGHWKYVVVAVEGRLDVDEKVDVVVVRPWPTPRHAPV
jgi:hypothetical protein